MSPLAGLSIPTSHQEDTAPRYGTLNVHSFGPECVSQAVQSTAVRVRIRVRSGGTLNSGTLDSKTLNSGTLNSETFNSETLNSET